MALVRQSRSNIAQSTARDVEQYLKCSAQVIKPPRSFGPEPPYVAERRHDVARRFPATVGMVVLEGTKPTRDRTGRRRHLIEPSVEEDQVLELLETDTPPRNAAFCLGLVRQPF
jgi:hypothetical protein